VKDTNKELDELAKECASRTHAPAADAASRRMRAAQEAARAAAASPAPGSSSVPRRSAPSTPASLPNFMRSTSSRSSCRRRAPPELEETKMATTMDDVTRTIDFNAFKLVEPLHAVPENEFTGLDASAGMKQVSVGFSSAPVVEGDSD